MIAIVTFIYPKAIKYFSEFISNIRQQTYQEIHLIIFNDGVHSDKIEVFNTLKHSVYNINGTPLNIRFKALEVLKNLPFEKYIFSDIDDLNSLNRIEIINQSLDTYPIVCNDLNIMQENCTITKHNVWRDRLNNHFEFDYTFIQNKNIIGFGNTGIRNDILSVNIIESSTPLVADWFIFYQLLKGINEKCLFTSKCQTNYRQHSNNQIGLKEIDDQRIKYVIDVIKKHYDALKEINCEKIELKQININNNPSLFWWEEIN